MKSVSAPAKRFEPLNVSVCCGELPTLFINAEGRVWKCGKCHEKCEVKEWVCPDKQKAAPVR